MFDSSVFLHSSPKKKKNWLDTILECLQRCIHNPVQHDELFCEISYWVKAVDYFLYKAPSVTFENVLNSYVLN